MHKLFYLSLILPFALNAQNNVSNADLSKKLDLILTKVGGLEQRVSRLESDNAEVKKEVKQVAKSAKEAKTATENLAIPKKEEDRKSFFNKLRIEMESDADRNQGPWTQPESWNKMKRNLTSHQVRVLLGNPSLIKGNLSPRIDQVYHYLGDLDADGVDDSALVNFYRGRVISFSSPFEK